MHNTYNSIVKCLKKVILGSTSLCVFHRISRFLMPPLSPHEFYNSAVFNFHTVVMCPVLSVPNNGIITYSEEASPTLGFMETATYSCVVGHGLSGGDRVRTCVGVAGSSGVWTGIAPRCEGRPTAL